MSSVANMDFDDILREIAKDLYKDSDINDLGKSLGLGPGDIGRTITQNAQQGGNYMGTLEMLRTWRKGRIPLKEKEELRSVLLAAGFVNLAHRYLGTPVAESAKITERPTDDRSKQGESAKITERPTDDRSKQGGNDEDIAVVGNVSPSSDEAEELGLWDYQEEVLAPALEGQNVMVVLPTGTGKTEVAIALISRRFLGPNPLGATNHRKQKSVFVVNKVPLMKQQKDRCLKYLRGKCKVAGTSGVESNPVPLDFLIDSNDITVLTAGMLVNALKDENIKLKLSDIALLVLDECHHCQKEDPYNVLMAMYRDLKLNSPELPRPQILGLTASPGVGNSKNMEQAERYITKLCANLDCRISRPKMYADQLNARSNSPQEILIVIKGRLLEDPFFREINVIMDLIEDKIKLVEAGRALVEENHEFAKMVSHRGTQSYEQGVVNLKRRIQETIENGDHRMELMTCVNYLREYNNSLFIYRDARTSDAISYMEDYINEEERSNPSGPADMILKKMFEDKLENLNQIANLPVSSNPVLNELRRQLKKAYAENEESLSIIFTKTRASVDALVKWINDDTELKHINAGPLIGSGNQGMTSTEQNRNLQSFKGEKFRILVATSVAEEGLDITNCNMVFRYNYVTSDIGHVQTKGRIRADCNGKIFVIVNSDLQLQDRELKNRMRVQMMNEAVHKIVDCTVDNQEAFDDRIRKEQEDDQKERQREKDRARNAKANKVVKSGIVLQCTNCLKEACLLDDIRCIKNHHHVVINDLFWDRIELVVPKKKKRIDEFTHLKDIHCAYCKHKWGTMIAYQKKQFPLIAIKNFELKDDKGFPKPDKWFPKTWKEVPFRISSIDMDDLGKQNNVYTAAEDPEGGQEKGEFEEDDVVIEYQTPCRLTNRCQKSLSLSRGQRVLSIDEHHEDKEEERSKQAIFPWMESGEGVKPPDFRPHEDTPKSTDDEGQIIESVHHISSPSALQDEIPVQNLESRKYLSEDADVIRLAKQGIEVRIPPNEAYCAKDVTVEPIHDIPTELVLKETEAIISIGLRMSPSNATFDIPVIVTMPHCGIFTKPEAAEVVTYYRKSASESFTAIPSSNGSPRCVVRHRDLDVYMDHFSEIWIVAIITQAFIGKRVICTPYIPVSTPKNNKHVLFVRVRDDNIGNGEMPSEYMTPIMGEQFLVRWRSGGLRITCKVDTNMEGEAKTLQESAIRHLNDHKVMFLVDTQNTDTNKVILHFILEQSTTKELLVPMHLKGDTASASLEPPASTSADIPLQDTPSTAAREVSTSRASDTVSDGKLNTLAAQVPHDKYYNLANGLGIGYNEASTILHNPGSTYQTAMRECLSIWKNKSGGSFTELKGILYGVELGGLYMNVLSEVDPI